MDTNARPPQLLCFGDSFVGPMRLLEKAAPERITVRSFGGASARGLSSPQATTRAGSEIRRVLESERLPSGSTLLFVFGNVDLQMNYLFRLLKEPALYDDVEEQFGFASSVADAYSSWLASNLPTCEAAGVSRICITTALHPIVTDDALPIFANKYINRFDPSGPSARKSADTAVLSAEWWEVQSRSGVVGPPPSKCIDAVRLLMQDEACRLRLPHQVAMTRFFNARFTSLVDRLHASRLSRCSLHIIDINPFMQDPSQQNVVVAAKLLTSDPTNVHPRWEETVGFWATELERAGVEMELCALLERLDMTRSREEYDEWKQEKAQRRNAQGGMGLVMASGSQGGLTHKKQRPKLHLHVA